MAAEPRPVFLAPHYDDVALSCGGTVANLADASARPLILTVFGGEPGELLNPFALKMHQDWGVEPGDAIALRRREEACAAKALGCESTWFELPDAIYRGDRYRSDEDLFGIVHPEDALLAQQVRDAILAYFTSHSLLVSTLYCPLGIGDHVDHQLLLAASRSLTYRGYRVLAYEDFPYAGDPGAEPDEVASIRSGNSPVLCDLNDRQLDRRVEAIRCYASQLDVIFRFQGGDAATATRRYAMQCGNGTPAERFWPL